MQDEQYKQIKAQCLQLLTCREHSQRELLQKLMTKKFSQDAVQQVIAELEQQGWQSDQRYAESYARQRILKGFGPIRIAYELKQRGVETIDLLTIVLQTTGSWLDLLEQIYRRKYTDDCHLSQKEWGRRKRYLQHRGFSGEMIGDLFKRLHIKFLNGY